MIVGLTASVCHGIMLPTMSLFFGGLANVFISQQKYVSGYSFLKLFFNLRKWKYCNRWEITEIVFSYEV